MGDINLWKTDKVFSPDSLDDSAIASVVRWGEIARLIADWKADSASEAIAILDQ